MGKTGHFDRVDDRLLDAARKQLQPAFVREVLEQAVCGAAEHHVHAPLHEVGPVQEAESFATSSD